MTNTLSIALVTEGDWPLITSQFRDFTFEQSLTYARAAAQRVGAELRLVTINAGNQLIAAAAVRVRCLPMLYRGIAWIASGPMVLLRDGVAPDPARLQAILEILRHQFVIREGHVLRLRLSGFSNLTTEVVNVSAARSHFVASRAAPGYQSFAIDLRQDADNLMERLNGKWRGHLRVALKSDLSLEMGNSPELRRRFLGLYETVLETKGFQPDIPPQFHFDLSGPDYALDVLIASKDGADIGGIVIATTGTIVVYIFGATTDPGRRFRAGYFLTWQAIALSRSRGLDWYDLGGVDFLTNPAVAEFKQKMNGTAITAPGPFESHRGDVIARLAHAAETVYKRLRR